MKKIHSKMSKMNLKILHKYDNLVKGFKRLKSDF